MRFILAILSLSAFSFACSSDYSCSLGYKRVKAPYQSTGTCMKKVDEYGRQSYEYSRDMNFGVKTEGDCAFDTDCPFGFSCDSYYKTCIKN